MSTTNTPVTAFTRDVIGRYVCNTFDEAMRSMDQSIDSTARPFDIIVIGGGSFGSALACHLFNLDKTHSHRILVLEAGPMVFTEHVQNQPLLSTDEVWGVPWNSDSPKVWNQRFPGLAYCVGGRSLFWGGWSPYLIDSELQSPPWPASVKRDLTEKVLTIGDEKLSYLDEAARQLGTDQTNDFVNGTLHFVLRDTLYHYLRDHPDHVDPRLVGNRGTPMNAKKSEEELEDELEAPLAVQSTSPRPGFFPFNKYSAIQLLIRAARMAQIEAEESAAGSLDRKNTRKRMMIVDNTHVIRVERDGRRITRIVTNQGQFDVPPDGRVFLGLGTIENTRMALNIAPNRDGLIGRNLMAHLRSNVTFRVKRSAFGDKLDPRQNPDLQSSALFVKGIHKYEDGKLGHFHVQITAAGVGAVGMDSEAQLFKKVPDIDLIERFKNLDDEYIVITLRGIGEMQGDKTSHEPQNRITQSSAESEYDYGMPRALVRLEAGPDHSQMLQLWDVMDRASDDLARALGNGTPVQYLVNGVWQDNPPTPDQRRDPLSSTHHEGGTLWMGEDAHSSVTDEWGRLHELDNLYAVGPSLLPTMGSPNPMLTCVALARRTAEHIIPRVQAHPAEPGFEVLFDGTETTYNSWQAVGQSAFALIDGNIVAQPDGDLGLLYYAPRTFGDLTLRLEFKLDRLDDNSGIFVRFRDPLLPVPDRHNPHITYPYVNQAYVGVDTGFEIQIDELARPDDADQHRTGAIYNIPIGHGQGRQSYHRGPILQPGRWHTYEIDVQGNTYRVRLDGHETAVYTNPDHYRGKGPDQDPVSGYIGLQSHTGRVAFRNIRIKVPTPVTLPALAVESGAIEHFAVVRQGTVPKNGEGEKTVKHETIVRKSRNH